MSLRKRTSTIIILIAAVAALAGWSLDWGVGVGADYVHEIRKNIEIFGLVYSEISQKYVDQIDPAKVLKAGINGMLNTLDPYTVLIEQEDNAQLQIMTSGKYGGLGMLIGSRDGWPTVVEPPYEGTPAQRAGIREGDQIIEVDGKITKGISTNEAASRLRGEVGTPVVIKIKREGEEAPIEFRLIRAEIVVHDVSYSGIVRDGIGYVKLTRFSKNAGHEVREAIRDLRSQNLQGIILDLRFNPGGLLESAVAVAENFIKKGDPVVSTRGRVEGSAQKYVSGKDPIAGDLPMVVLVNEFSASASEIVAGAIQDLDRGVIMGAPTYGKGLVQTVVRLTNEAQLKVTTAKYYIPSGRLIQKESNLRRDEMDIFAEDGDEVPAAAEEEKAKQEKPDESSTALYQTAHGREVFGGGGIKPDVEVPLPKLNQFEIALSRKMMLFNFAAQFAARHAELKPGFQVDEQMLALFQQFLTERQFTYESQSEEHLASLRKAAEQDGYLADIKGELEALEQALLAEKKDDFAKSRDFIRRNLEREISSKLWGTRAEVEAGFDDDPVIQRAVNLLLSPEEYTTLLAGNGKAKG
jgi:carboxyl-terminal processing protease